MSRHEYVYPGDVRLISPVPQTWYPLVWGWMQQYPENTLDDDGPQSWQDLATAHEMAERGGALTYGVLLDGEPVGFGSVALINPKVAMTTGIYFCREVHGTGVAKMAVQRVLLDLFAHGITKVQAACYTHNLRGSTFLRELGAVEEGLLRNQVIQHGRLVSMKLVAIFAPEAA